jgi:hypothetical protein
MDDTSHAEVLTSPDATENSASLGRLRQSDW